MNSTSPDFYELCPTILAETSDQIVDGTVPNFVPIGKVVVTSMSNGPYAGG